MKERVDKKKICFDDLSGSLQLFVILACIQIAFLSVIFFLSIIEIIYSFITAT